MHGLVGETRPARDIDVEASDPIVVAGGLGPMFTIEKAKDLRVKFVAFYEAGKVAAALRHGVSILRYATLKDGVGWSVARSLPASLEEYDADKMTWQWEPLRAAQQIVRGASRTR